MPTVHSSIRNKCISKHLKDELAVFIKEVEDAGRDVVLTCPFCGRVSNRARNMKRHLSSHLEGKFAGFVNPDEGGRSQHPVPECQR